MNSEFSRDNVMNSFIAPHSARSIVRIKYLCEPDLFDDVFVHVVSLLSSITYSFPSPLLQNKN
jgi:phenylalanine-4-hydroxylase